MNSYLALTLAVLATVTYADPILPPNGHVDVRTPAKQIVSDVRDLVAQAKGGMGLNELYTRVVGIKAAASGLSQVLPDQATECETGSLIKMAAASIGSHESMLLLLADDELSMMNGRLSQALAFLDRLAQKLEDELAVSNEFGSNLAAIIFGTEATTSILNDAEEVINSILNNNNNNNDNTGASLGNGWTLGPNGLPHWQSTTGYVSFNAPSHGRPQAHDIAKRQTSVDLKLSYSQKSGWGASVKLTIKF